MCGLLAFSVNVICPGFVLTELVKKQIPEQVRFWDKRDNRSLLEIQPRTYLNARIARCIRMQAARLQLSEQEVIKKVMLGNTVDGEFSTVDDVAQVQRAY